MSYHKNQKIFKAGEIIMRQGEHGKSAYVVESGRVEILLNEGDGDLRPIGTRGAGALIGEMAIIDDAPRTATVRALEDCQLLEITKDDFTLKLGKANPILRMTTQVILTRYRDLLKRSHIEGGAGQVSSDDAGAEMIELGLSDGVSALESIRIANDFESALKNNHIQMHYQPILNLKSGKIAGFEALMRWEDPIKGAISPGVFIPVIEDSGLIVEATAFAQAEALQALKRIEARAGYDRDLFMSVNFTSRDFAADGFVDGLHDVIQANDVSPAQLHIEITERLLMGQPDRARETLEACKAAGMSISIDDFGTGFSSLSYLHYFPIDKLKIDRSFILDMSRNEKTLELVRSIIGLGKNMNMEIIAEGVEHREEIIILRHLGCDMGQGYYFAKPMPEDELITLMASKDAFEI